VLRARPSQISPTFEYVLLDHFAIVVTQNSMPKVAAADNTLARAMLSRLRAM
jgi:hypothetical protein